MSEPETKRVKTDESSPPYELVYWPGIPGRGEFIRLLFEEAGVPYSDAAVSDPSSAVPAMMALTSPESSDPEKIGQNPPPLAPPILRHGELLISQTTNIMQYLAPKLGLAPTGGNAIFHLNAIALTLLDGLVNELHDTHHPVCVTLYYEDQKDEAKKKAKAFIDNRLPKWFGYVQRILDSSISGEGPWLYGDSLTYVDLVLFQTVDGSQFAFPKSLAALKESGKYDGVFKLYEAVKERPNIKAYLASDRRQKYGDGLYRYYPELEE